MLLAADISVGQCFQLARQITEGYRKGEFDAVKLCYTRFDSMMTQTAVSIEVLPLAMEPTEQQKAEARRSQILYKPSSEEVFSAIIPEYVAGEMCIRDSPQSYDLLSPDNREVQAAHTPAGAGGHRCGR